jgi:glycosyltransferase involved in cell wall biosynthesis
LRLLVLATYFPKPERPLMGIWALLQAQALRRAGVYVTVVSPTSWLPSFFGRLPGRWALEERARAWAACPARQLWGDLEVRYPRWLFYEVGSRRGASFRDPRLPLKLGWVSGRRALERAVREQRPDVLLGHHTARGGFLAERPHQRFGLPFVTVDHDYDEVRECERHRGRRRLYQQVTGAAFASIAVSRDMEADLRRLFPSARPRTNHNGTDPLPEALARVPRPPALRGRVVVFSAAMFYERKAMPLLVEAFAKVADRHTQAVLRIAGDGAQRPAVEQAIERNGLQRRVELLGTIDHSAVLQEMVWSDVFALIGWEEPFGTVFVEAMSAGKPLLWSSDGGISDCARSGVHGYAVTPRNVAAAAAALDRLLGDEGARRAMGERGRELFESELTWDANAARLVPLLMDACRSACQHGYETPGRLRGSGSRTS